MEKGYADAIRGGQYPYHSVGGFIGYGMTFLLSIHLNNDIYDCNIEGFKVGLYYFEESRWIAWIWEKQRKSQHFRDTRWGDGWATLSGYPFLHSDVHKEWNMGTIVPHTYMCIYSLADANITSFMVICHIISNRFYILITLPVSGYIQNSNVFHHEFLAVSPWSNVAQGWMTIL